MTERASIPECAEFIAALLNLNEKVEGKASVPNGGGILDRALETLFEECADRMPERFRAAFSFGTGSVGRHCYELPDILLRMEEMMLAETDGSTFTTMWVVIDTETSRQILVSFGLHYDDYIWLSGEFHRALEGHLAHKKFRLSA